MAIIMALEVSHMMVLDVDVVVPVIPGPTRTIDAVLIPIAVQIEPGSKLATNAKGNKTGGLVVHYLRLIDGDVDNFGLSGNDANVRLFDYNLLLGRRNEVAEIACLLTQTLDRLHEVIRLRDKCLPELLCPIKIGIHVLQDGGVVRDCFDARIPILRIDLILGRSGSHKLGSADNVEGIGRSGKELREKGIWIERHGTCKLIELLGGVNLHRLLWLNGHVAGEGDGPICNWSDIARG